MISLYFGAFLLSKDFHGSVPRKNPCFFFFFRGFPCLLFPKEKARVGGSGRGGVIRKRFFFLFRKSPFSRQFGEFRDSRDSFQNPQCVEEKEDPTIFYIFQKILGSTLSGPVRDTPPYRAIPFRDSIAEGGIAPICLVSIGYRASIAEIPLLRGGIAPPLRMLSRGETLRKGGGGIAPNWPC